MLVCVLGLHNSLDLNSLKKDISVYQASLQAYIIHSRVYMCVCFSPCGCSQQHLPVVAPAVNEDITSSTIGACAAETLWGVALLQRAFVLLHGQTVVGKTQLLMGCFWVQFEGLACEDTEFYALLEICYCILSSTDAHRYHQQNHYHYHHHYFAIMLVLVFYTVYPLAQRKQRVMVNVVLI